MTSIFETVSKKIKDSYLVIWVFIASLVMLMIGANHFVEDYLSSYYGIQELKDLFGLVAVSYPLTYATMSLSPQIAQIVFAYMGLMNARKNWWTFLAFGLFWFMDAFSDMYYRSGTHMFDSPSKFFASGIFTFVYFTLGSELFITVGFGMVMANLFPFIIQTRKAFSELSRAFNTALPHQQDSRPNMQHRVQELHPEPQRMFQQQTVQHSSKGMTPTEQQTLGDMINLLKFRSEAEREVVLRKLNPDMQRQIRAALARADARKQKIGG